MQNPNKPNDLELARTEDTLAELTPEPASFGGSIYEIEEVRKDEDVLEIFQNSPNYKEGEERSDAKLLEKTFIDMAERDDWFGEDELYGEDPDYLALITFPTAKIDDAFNHIDVVCMISNEATRHKTVPFAIDLTYNTDFNKMRKKFSWRHVHGKTASAPADASEFGEIMTENGTIKSRRLPIEYRDGLKIPGFASAKYYEDKNNPWDPMHEKGRIEIMPRFIVGYSPELADTLAHGAPTDEYRRRYGEQEYQQRKTEFRDAKLRAKWCTLIECTKQARDIHRMLDSMTPEETGQMDPKELETAKKQIMAMEIYFTSAMSIARKQAENSPEQKAAIEYASNIDIVCQSILNQSESTFIRNDW